MDSDAAVTVTESATQIVMTPTGEVSSTGVFFQPGAKVDARAYAAVLRPLAEAGFTDDQFLRTVYTLSSSVFGVVAFLYQGGMALYYHRRRAAITAALNADSDSEK